MNICSTYKIDKLLSAVLGQCVAFFIIAMNKILQAIIIKLISWIGEDTFSKQLTSITNMVFIAQFFNTGILLLLVNANMSEHNIPIAFGPFYDYSPQWYIDVGQKLVQTQIIGAVVPYGVTMGVGFGLPIAKRWWDTNKTFNHFKTKKTSRAAFKALYSGNEYVIHFKFSGVLTVVYVTFMYGMGLPLLFPIAAISIFGFWVNERVNIAYISKLPPSLDDKLTKNAIDLLKWAPLLLCFNGYWMISNKQIFMNTWEFIEKTGHQMRSEHYFYMGVNWASPLLFVIFFAVIIQFLQRFFLEQLQTLGFGMSKSEIQVDEDLPHFFNIIKMSQRDQLIKMTNNMKSNFGFEYTDPDTVQALKDAPFPEFSIVGTPWYNVLSNPTYTTAFGFVGSYVNEREKIICDGYPIATDDLSAKYKCEQSDLVMILLNLAYIPDIVIQEVDFTKAGWSILFKERMDLFKQHFFEESGVEWEFQNDKLEQTYIAFKTNIDQSDDGYSERIIPTQELDYIKERRGQFQMSQSQVMGLN